MQTPEILLKDLNSALRNLRGAASLLGDEDRLDSEFLPVVRRLLLAEVLGNTPILAIGGSQGAGKTTLLCTLYGLEGADAAWLPPNEGRGEKLPVLVQEEVGRSKVQGAVRHLVKYDEDNKHGSRYVLQEDDVDVAKFQEAIHDNDARVLLPILKVPQRFFSNSAHAWLLLPGYEKQDRDNKEWQELMRQALIAATGCLIVTDETRMAASADVEIVKDMLAKELCGSQALIVISKTEGARGKPDRLKQLRTTAQEVFGVAAEQADRWIVCAGGLRDKDYRAEWLPHVEAAIQDLSISGGGGDRKAQLAQLESVLGRDLSRVLTRIGNKTQLFLQGIKNSVGEETLKNFLEAFDDAKENLRADYHKAIEEFLTTQYAEAWENLKPSLRDNHEGLWNWVKGIPQTATESQLRIEADLNNAWKKPGSILEKHANALAGLAQKSLGGPKECTTEGTALQRLGYVGADQQVIHWTGLDDSVHKNLLSIFVKNKDSDKNAAHELDKSCERTVKLLPALMLEYARVASMMPTLVGVNPDSLAEMTTAERPDLVNLAVKNLEAGVDLSKTVLRTIATVLAVDVASDGDVDTIPALLNAIGLGSTAAASSTTAGSGAGGAATAGSAAIGGVGAAVVGTVAVGYVVYSAMREIRQQDDKARGRAQQMLWNIKDHHSRHFLIHFDDLMNKARERLREAIRQRYHLDESLMEKDRLAKALSDVRALQRDLLHELGRSGHTVGLFNVEA